MAEDEADGGAEQLCKSIAQARKEKGRNQNQD
jgi:hypothetical protein